MQQYDIALGLDSATISHGLEKLHAKPDAYEKFFKGIAHGYVENEEFTVNWELTQAPKVTLSSPALSCWKQSIGPDGSPVNPELPSGNLFQVSIPAVCLTMEMESIKITKLVLYGKIDVRENINALCITPLAVNEADSNLNGIDQVIFNTLVLPNLFSVLTRAADSLELPPLHREIFGQEYTFLKPSVKIQDGYLVLATSRTDQSLNIEGASWPKDQPAFLLLKPAFAAMAAAPKLGEKLGELNRMDRGEIKGKNLWWQYKLFGTQLQELIPVEKNPLAIKVSFQPKIEAMVIAGNDICSITAATK